MLVSVLFLCFIVCLSMISAIMVIRATRIMPCVLSVLVLSSSCSGANMRKDVSAPLHSASVCMSVD